MVKLPKTLLKHELLHKYIPRFLTTKAEHLFSKRLPMCFSAFCAFDLGSVSIWLRVCLYMIFVACDDNFLLKRPAFLAGHSFTYFLFFKIWRSNLSMINDFIEQDKEQMTDLCDLVLLLHKYILKECYLIHGIIEKS